ncbi:SET domain-containing protein, partial [Aureobasidium melanogenum]
MTCRLPRRKAARESYNLRHPPSDRHILRNVEVSDEDCAQDQCGVSQVDDASQSTSNSIGQQPTNRSAKPSDTGGRANDLPAERASDSLRTQRYQPRYLIHTPTHQSSPTSGKSKSEGEASEAELKGRRQSRRLLDTKRVKKTNETLKPCIQTVNNQLVCAARPSSNAKGDSLVASPRPSCLGQEELSSTSDQATAPANEQIRVVKPKGWVKIHKTRFVGDAKKYWKRPSIETSRCVCTWPAPGFPARGCDESCLNRAMDYECDSNNCGLGDLCTNREFAEIKPPTSDPSSFGVEIIETFDRGFGVRARRPYKPHQIIIEHTGEIITPNEADRRMKEDYKNMTNYYQMGFDQGMILDATKGSISRFVNHSCEPNCKMLKRSVEGQPRIALFVGDRGISTGEELTYDYNFNPYSSKSVQECRCGASNCRGILGPTPRDSKKPIGKIEEQVASGTKRKVGGIFGAASAVETIEVLSKKRKVPRMSKGWVYVDDDMEKIRAQEARNDREIARLRKEGLLSAKLEARKVITTPHSLRNERKAMRSSQRN